ALKASAGKVAGRDGAAALLGMNPNTLTSRLRKLGLKKAFAG
ncbi:MAG: helix-turn-helix domain-containing protein, partial [Bacteroidota bacterium]